MTHNSASFGAGGKAMRFKHYGIWQSYSWAEYLENVKYLALGLRSLGFEPGSKLLIVGDNSPEWFFAQMAAQSNRGISVGLYSDLSPEEIEYAARDCEADFAMVEDQEQVDKLDEVRERLPHLKAVVFWRYKGLSDRDRSFVHGLRDVVAMGRDYEAAHPAAFEERIESGAADDICSIVYTSGTGDRGPKGTLHSHRSLMTAARAFCDQDGLGTKDDFASYLPPAWITEQWLSFGSHLLSGGIVDYAESAVTHQEDIREIAPTAVVYNSRLWESQAGQVQARMRGASAVKRLVTRWFMPVGYRRADLEYQRRKPGLPWRLLDACGDRIVFRPIRDSLGLPRARVCYTSGSMLSDETIRFFHALRVPLKNVYGSAEAGAVTGAAERIQTPGTVGSVNAGVETKVTERGELAVRHQGTFLGYCGSPELTAQVLDDGWVRTGDKCSVNGEGALVFTDRLDDLITLPCGDVVAPQSIESRLKCSPYIKDAWVLAHEDCETVSAVVIIDAANTGRWAERRKARYTTFNDLSQNPDVYGLIEQELAQVNRDLPQTQRIDRFVHLHREFDPDELELTRDRKLRRAFLYGRYEGLVRALRDGATTALVESQAAPHDARTEKIETALTIATVGREGQ